MRLAARVVVPFMALLGGLPNAAAQDRPNAAVRGKLTYYFLPG